MYTKLLSALRKVGIILGTAVITSATSFLVGVAFSLAGNKGWIHLGEYQPWLPIIGLEYGFFLGIVLGVIIWKKSDRSRASKRLSQ
jgi:hypothetical protein